MQSLAPVLLTLALALPAFAADGRLEINQACAEGPGCFPGDSGGFPVTITALAGTSYVLTGNLQVADEDTDAIRVSNPNVTVDLGGFEIRGVTTCSGEPLICSPTGLGSGVSAFSGSDRLRVINGSIVGMGFFAARLPPLGVAENVRASQNGTAGFIGSDSSVFRNNVVDLNGGGIAVTSPGVTISGNTVVRNGNLGIRAGAGAMVAGNTVHSNAGSGISAGDGSTITGNIAYLNGAVGIAATHGSLIQGNTTHQNASDGIRCLSAATIVDNTSYGNDGSGASDDGIDCGSDCFVRGNTVTDNDYGIRLGPGSLAVDNNATDNRQSGIYSTGADSRIDGNNVAANADHGIEVVGATNLIVRNSARANTNGNYDIAADNRVGVIIVPPQSAAITGNGPGAGTGTLDPWANFAY